MKGGREEGRVDISRYHRSRTTHDGNEEFQDSISRVYAEDQRDGHEVQVHEFVGGGREDLRHV